MAPKPLKSPPQPDPEAKAEARRLFRKELLIASGAHLLLFLFLFRGPLLSAGVDSFQARPDPPAALLGMSEMVYQLQPALFTQARVVRAGEFPSWSPYSQGGTPLIGKILAREDFSMLVLGLVGLGGFGAVFRIRPMVLLPVPMKPER